MLLAALLLSYTVHMLEGLRNHHVIVTFVLQTVSSLAAAEAERSEVPHQRHPLAKIRRRMRAGADRAAYFGFSEHFVLSRSSSSH